MSWAGLFNWLLLLTTLSVCVIAGRPASPYFDPVLFNAGKLAGRSWPGDHTMLWYGSRVAITGVVLAIAYLPAALVWRFAPRRAALLASRMIWLAAATALAWPALRAMLESDD